RSCRSSATAWASSPGARPGSQSSWTKRRGPSSELFQHPHVVVEEHPQVGDAVLEHGDPLDAHPEGEAVDALGLVAAREDNPKDVRVAHPRAEDLEPAGPLAEVAALAVEDAGAAAAGAGDADLDARLAVREKVRCDPA